MHNRTCMAIAPRIYLVFVPIKHVDRPIHQHVLGIFCDLQSSVHRGEDSGTLSWSSGGHLS
jgi:hypothetical protein